MLFMHEVHKVRGRAEDEFEAAFRDGWMATLGAGDEARLLWYANHAHGTGPAYTVVTVTAVRDGAAWERLARRIQRGDLQQWMRELDALRHDVAAYATYPGYAARQRLAIEYAERFANDHASIDDAFFGRLREVFTDAEILDLTLCVAVFLGLGRSLSVLGVDQSCAIDL